MREAITVVLMLAGAVFSLLAAVGIVRLPDLFTRMQAAAKGGTLGAGLLILAVAVYFGELGVTTRVVLIIVFLFMTAPVAAHMIARAAYMVGVPLWEGTIQDDLRRHLDERKDRHPGSTKD